MRDEQRLLKVESIGEDFIKAPASMAIFGIPSRSWAKVILSQQLIPYDELPLVKPGAEFLIEYDISGEPPQATTTITFNKETILEYKNSWQNTIIIDRGNIHEN